MTHLTVYEWGGITIHKGSGAPPAGQFSHSQADALLAAACAHPLASTNGTNILVYGRDRLIARQMVGVIAAPGCSLEILPKIAPDPESKNESDDDIRKRLIRMLDIALGVNISDGLVLGMARQKETLLDILIRVFADRLLVEVRRGLPRAYVALEEDLPTLRGKLDVRRQFTTLAVRPDKLACRYDALISDTPLLRIMKACVVHLRAHARALETIRRLDELRFLLADVSDLHPSVLPWAQVHIDRSSRRWETLYSLAQLFLKRQWQATHHDQKGGAGITLLFPMNTLFEAYITALTRQALRGTKLHDKGLTLHAQGGRLFCLVGADGKQRFQTKLDILIKQDGKPALVIDTKWKRIAKDPEHRLHGLSQADIYQLMAYSRIYQCPHVMLLYPHHAELGDKELDIPHTILGGQERLWLASIDIVCKQDGSQPVQGMIVQRLEELIGQSLPGLADLQYRAS